MFWHKITQLSHRIDKKNVTDINFRMDSTTLKKIHPRIYNESIENRKGKRMAFTYREI